MKRIGQAASLAVLVGLGAGTAAQETGSAESEAPSMTWPEATELLQREKLSAEVCAKAVKLHLPEGDRTALTAAEHDYEAGRAEFNAVISGLQVALMDPETEAPALDVVEERISAGVEAREAFCDDAERLMADQESGEKSVIAEVVAGSLSALIEAGMTIWKYTDHKDALRRGSISTALEGAKWPVFSDIEP
jgi:hypothetical protein